ncbi:MAG: zinc-binding dehydrogenase [Christensenella sp.]|nr:zinc-binding dehydrogenase [Christensenella sp.]
MKALVKLKRGPGNLELIEVDKPEPKEDEVVIRVESAGVCGTDIKILHDATWSNPPVTLGHEYSGVVDSIGSAVKNLKVGDRVVSETAQVICGNCKYCKTGLSLMCKDRLSIGYGVDGAFAEYIKVRKDIVHKLPDSVSFDDAAMFEPLSVALHATWDKANVLPTDTVLVMGPGAIGQFVSLVTKARGATVVLTGTEKDIDRLKIAKDNGIDYTTTNISLDYLKETVGVDSVDVVFDCTGALPAIKTAMPLVKPTGKFVQIGLTKPELEIEYSLLTAKEISIIGTFGHQWHNWEQAIELVGKKKLNISNITTGHYPLKEWKQAFDDMEAQRGIKILIHPNL